MSDAGGIPLIDCAPHRNGHRRAACILCT